MQGNPLSLWPFRPLLSVVRIGSATNAILVSTALVWIGAARAEVAGSQTISLSDAVSQATNLSIAAKRAAIAVSQAQLNAEIVDRSDDPTLGLSGAWGVKYQKRTSSSAASFQEHTKIHTYGAQLRYTLYDFGKQSAKEQSAASNLKVQELAKDQADELLFWSVVRAYQKVAAAERVLEVTREQLTISQSRLTEQRRNYKQGLRPESDVVTAEVDVGKAKISVESAADQVLLAKQALALLLNPDEFNPTPSFVITKGTVAVSSPKAWTELVAAIEKMGVQEKAAARILAANRTSLSADEAALDASTRPVLGTLVSGDYTGENGKWSPLRPSASGQVQLTWDIPWNGMSRLSRENLVLKKQDIELQEKNLKNTIDQSEQNARTSLEQTKRLYQAMVDQRSLVEKQRKFVLDRYRVGQASALEVSTAEAALVSLKLDQVKLSSSVADAIVTFAEARGVKAIELLSKL